MKKSTKIILSSVAASIIMIGCGGGGGSSSSTASTTGSVSGTATDGPVANAKVCLDLNFNQKCDPNEPVATTDATGKFTVTYKLNEQNSSIAPVLILPTPDSVDTYTGNKFTIKISAPRAGQNNVVVSPITTVAAAAVYQQVENNKTITPDVVKNVVTKVAQSLDLNGTDITQVNPTENPKLLVTAVTLANVIADGNITQVATNIVDNNDTNITAALPGDYQSVYETMVNAVDENTTLDTDKLQQLVQSSIETNNTAVLEKIVSDNNVTDTDIALALVEGQLNIIYNDLNSSGMLEVNATGMDYNISDMNVSYVAEQLVNEYNITDAKTLMEQYKNTEFEVNLTSAGNKTNLSSAIEMYNILQSVKAFRNSVDVKLADLNLTNVTFFRMDVSGSPLYFDQNGTFVDYSFDEDSGTLNEDANGLWNKLDNVLVIKYNNYDNPAFVGVEETNSTLLPVIGYDVNGKEFTDNIIVANLTPASEVNSSSEIMAAILNAKFNEYNATDINGSTYITQSGTKLTFETDGTALLNGKNIGTWEVDTNGAIILPYKNGGKVYVLKGNIINEYSADAYFVFVDADGHVMSIQETPFTKYVENVEAVTLAKNIFSSLRTQIDSVSNAASTGTLDTEANKFSNQLKDLTLNNVESAGNTLMTLIGAITNNETNGSVEIDNPDLNRTFTLSTDDNKTYNYSIKDDLNGTTKEYNGTIAFNTALPQDINSSFDVTMNIQGQLPASDEEEISQDINTSAELKYDADNYTFNLLIDKMNITDADKSVGINNISIESAGTDQNLSEIKYLKLNSFAVSGKAGDFEVNGSVSVDYVQNKLVQAQSNDQAFNYYYNVQGYFVCMDENGDVSYSMNLPSDINVTVDGNTYTLPVNPSDAQADGNPWYNIYATVESSDDIDVGEWYYPLEQAVEQQIECNDTNYTAHIYDNYGPTIWVDKDEDFLNDGWIPDNITFKGTVKDVNTSTTLEGTISASSSDIGSVDLENTEGLNTEISLAVKLIREGFADTNVNSKFTSSTDGTTTFDFSYSVEGTTFGTITLSGKWDKDGNGAVSITSTSGLKVTIPVKKGDIDYTNPIPVYVTDKVVGYIEQRDGIPVIKYNDGTFESIN